MGPAVEIGSLAEAHRSQPGTLVESLEVVLVHAGPVRTIARAGGVCDLLVADGSMYMSVTLLGCIVVGWLLGWLVVGLIELHEFIGNLFGLGLCNSRGTQALAGACNEGWTSSRSSFQSGG